MGCCEIFILTARERTKEKNRDNDKGPKQKGDKNKADLMRMEREKNTDRVLIPHHSYKPASKPSQECEQPGKMETEEPQLSLSIKNHSEYQVPTDTQPETASISQSTNKKLAQIHSRFFKQFSLSIIEQNSSKMEAGSYITNVQPQNISHLYATQLSMHLKNIRVEEILEIDEANCAENKRKETSFDGNAA